MCEIFYLSSFYLNGANDGIRTHDLLDGNQMLYQLSYIRIENGGGGGNRTHVHSSLD